MKERSQTVSVTFSKMWGDNGMNADAFKCSGVLTGLPGIDAKTAAEMALDLTHGRWLKMHLIIVSKMAENVGLYASSCTDAKGSWDDSKPDNWFYLKS